MPKPVDNSQEVTLVPRVKGFANQYITKGSYSDAEFKIKRLAVLIFNSEGNLAFSKEYNTSSVVLNKTMLNLNSATVVMFANVSLSDIKKQTIDAEGTSTWTDITTDTELTLEGLDGYSIDLGNNPVVLETELGGEAFNGFPMKGIASNVNLTPSASDAVEVNLQILYAKVNFEIGVAAGTENQNYEGVTPSFTPSGYSVTNVPTSTPVKELNDDESNGVVESTPIGTTYKYTGTQSDQSKTVSTNTATFTFYMAESRYNHGGTDGVYPDNLPEDNKQQYKPLLATNGIGSPAKGMATYVTVNGTYKDYRGTSWTVNYKVYLGKNNSYNFHVDRNSEYTNILTIKGIRNNSGYGTDDVWIDHRVDVSTNDISKHVTITRETLIDSHIEVRPLRVKWDGDTYAGVRVYLPTDDSNGKLLDWIGMERFTGENCLDGSIYCYVYDSATKQNVAIGKRKYFTTTLISELQSKGGEFGVQTDNGKKFIYLLNGECVWIYFDEHTGNADRDATIRLEFYSKDGKTISPEEYLIKQRALQTIGDYAIESYEEYLHTYDSADKYNLSTSPSDYTQQGIAWGLNNKTLSGDVIVTSMQLTPINIPVFGGQIAAQEVINQRYDFFHNSDIPQGVNKYYIYAKNNGTWDDATFQTGLDFTNRATTPKEGVREGITIKDMGTIPDNAYQYCLSKNKFKEDPSGNHTLDIHWYLPDIYELKTVLGNVQASADFKDGVYYWSSQPSFTNASDISEYILGAFGTDLSIKEEVPTKARALYSQFGDSNSNPSDIERNNKNRIRCFYSAEGIKNVDMSERVPNGLGGNHVFYMRVWENINKASEGYFSFFLDRDEGKPKHSEDNSQYQYNDHSFAYPTADNVGSDFSSDYFTAVDKDGKNIVGFKSIDPTNSNNWKRESKTVIDGNTYYTTLYTFPGLSKYDLEVYKVAGQAVPTYNSYRELSTQKKDTKLDLVEDVITFSKSLNSNSELEPAQDAPVIFSFDIGNNDNSNAPFLEYDELFFKSERVYERLWDLKYPPCEYTTPTQKTRDVPYSGDSDKKEATSRDSDKQTAINNAKEAAISAAQTQARTRAIEAARAAHPTATSVTPQDGTESYQQLSYDEDTYRTVVDWKSAWRADVETKYRCTMNFTIEYTGTTIPYIGFPAESPWVQTYFDGKEYYDKDPIKEQVNKDQLRMYCGNFVTVSVTDPNYEISKVKIYYTGSNEMSSIEIFGSYENVYARFVDTSITLPGKKTINSYGSNESLQLEGMDYNENDKWHQWSGDPTSSVTLALADYRVRSIANYSHEYEYDHDPDEPSKYLIIDRIEVKCTKKAIAATE